MNPSTTARRILGALVLLASIVLWLPSDDVARLIILNHPILLGRYSVSRFNDLLILTPLLWVLAGLLFSRRRFDRVLAFQVITITGSTVLGVLLVFILSRMVIPPRYQEQRPFGEHYRQVTLNEYAGATGDAPLESLQGKVVHREPGLNLSFTYADVPRVARSYPNAPPGYPAVSGTLKTDSRGFRNRQALERADVVAVGDSFTEGSRVSDEDTWPEVLARHSGLSVYNLGVSALGPQEYLNNFITHGLALKPRILVLMFYEGNDFVTDKGLFEPRRKRLLRDSPLGSALHNLLLNTFGSINVDAPLPAHPALAWMPAAVRVDDVVQYYSFGPDRMLKLLVTPQELARAPEWATVTRILRQLRQAAQANDVRFILAYAPMTSRIVLPLIRDQLTDEGLHALAAADSSELPPVAGFKDYVFARLDTKENALQEFCRAEGIEFVSTTPLLRARTAAGEQVYYTYDTHWSPAGQHVVGTALAQYLQTHVVGPVHAPGRTATALSDDTDD